MLILNFANVILHTKNIQNLPELVSRLTWRNVPTQYLYNTIPTQTSLEGALFMYTLHIAGIYPFQDHTPFNQEDRWLLVSTFVCKLSKGLGMKILYSKHKLEGWLDGAWDRKNRRSPIFFFLSYFSPTGPCNNILSNSLLIVAAWPLGREWLNLAPCSFPVN